MTSASYHGGAGARSVPELPVPVTIKRNHGRRAQTVRRGLLPAASGESIANAAASLSAAITEEPEPAAYAGPLLWPVISGLLHKDPAWRLGAAQAEWMLRRAADEPAVRARASRPTCPSARLREPPGRCPEVRLAS